MSSNITGSKQCNIEDIKTPPLVIFGAGLVGEILFYACRKLGLKVKCFCDNNKNKSKSKLCGLDIIHPDNLKMKYPDAAVVISAADIKDVIDQLSLLGVEKWCAGASILKDFDISEAELSSPFDFAEYAVATCINCHSSYLAPDRLFLRSVDLIITERCSLKCRDCSNLMQYYETPANCDIDMLFESIDAFCKVVDEVNEFRVIGGEPLMNPQYHLIIKKLIDEPKVKKVVIYTNGTIVPGDDKIQYMKDGKVLFLITDYGPELSKKIAPMTQTLEQNNIPFYCHKVAGWTSCAKVEKHNRNPQERLELFRNCCAKNTVTLSNGKLYRCPFAANVERLKAVPYSSNDYIDIQKEVDNCKDILKLKGQIRNFLMGKKFLDSCDYCNGRTFGDQEIEPAVQIEKPVAYKKYKY